MSSTLQDLWNSYLEADSRLYNIQQILLDEAENLDPILKRALMIPEERPLALQLLTMLPEASSRKLLPELVSLASLAHSEISLVREVILNIDKGWLIENIDRETEKVLELAASSPYGDYEEHMRIAELYAMLDNGLLVSHLRRLEQHPNERVHEILTLFKGQ